MMTWIFWKSSSAQKGPSAPVKPHLKPPVAARRLPQTACALLWAACTGMLPASTLKQDILQLSLPAPHLCQPCNTKMLQCNAIEAEEPKSCS